MNDNIISVNIPNGVSILIIVAVGFLALAAVKKLAGGGRGSAKVSAGPTFSG